MFQTITSRLITIATGLLIAIAASPTRAQDFRVEGAGLEAMPTSYRGPCPGLIKFAGKIQANAAGRVKYTYFRSDGASGPEGFVDFEGPGVKLVESSWTLGGGALNHFEGWLAIRILSPNSYESNQAKFVLDCGDAHEKQPTTQPTNPQPTEKQPVNPQTIIPQQPIGVVTRPQELGQPVAPSKEKLDQEMAGLKSFSERLQPSLTAAQSKMSSDSAAMEAEFRAIAQEPDSARRSQLGAEFQARYEPHLLKLVETAGIDLIAQRGQVLTLLGLSNKPVKESKTLAIECCPGLPDSEEPNGASPSQPPITEGLPDVTEQVLSTPYTSAGTSGDHAEAYAATGELKFTNHVVFAANTQMTAFVSQNLEVARGTRRVRVSASFDPVYHYLDGMSLPPTGGYSSAEAIVNLRVMDGSRIVASDRISLARVVTAVVGEGHTSGNRPVSLSCEFTRPEPGDATTYTIIAEIEGWAGVGGLAYATAQETARLRQFHVYLHRR